MHGLYGRQMISLKKQDNFSYGSEDRDKCLYIVQNIILAFGLYQQAAGAAYNKRCCLGQFHLKDNRADDGKWQVRLQK